VTKIWKYLKIGMAAVSAIEEITKMVEGHKVDSAGVEAAVLPALAAAGLEADQALVQRIIGFAVMAWAQTRA